MKDDKPKELSQEEKEAIAEALRESHKLDENEDSLVYRFRN